MAVTTPRVRDFTTTDRGLKVEVVSGDAFEVLISLYALTGDEDESDFEIESDWFEGIRERTGEELLARLGHFGDWSVWIALFGEAYSMGAPHTIEHFLEHLERIDPIELRRGLLEVGACHASETIGADDLEALATGEADVVAAAEEWCEKCPGLLELLKLPAMETRDTLVGLVRRFWEADPLPEGVLKLPTMETRDTLVGLVRRFWEADPLPEGVAGILAQDAERKLSMARRMDPVSLIEKATNGITVAVRPDLGEVVLVPSVILRPWTVIAEQGGRRIFCYSVAEENLGLDPDAPPAWLVQFYKALGDERRLTIVRRLTEGPASFGELVELLGLAKSTVHHHIRQLRKAGVVRVTLGAEKEHSLRTGTVPEAARLLEGFLGTHTQDDR